MTLSDGGVVCLILWYIGFMLPNFVIKNQSKDSAVAGVILTQGSRTANQKSDGSLKFPEASPGGQKIGRREAIIRRKNYDSLPQRQEWLRVVLPARRGTLALLIPREDENMTATEKDLACELGKMLAR